ncbi:MAG: helix-turn-helix domain-containing protein, partial [Planctomycetota bacterium]
MAHSFSILSRLRAVRDADLSGALASKGISMWSAKGVLYTLTTYADEEGVAYPTIATIARTMDASRRTVQSALAALVDAGILSDWQGKDDVSWTVWVVDYARLGALAGAPSRRAPGSVTAQRARRESAPGASWCTTNSTGKTPENEPHNTPPEGGGAEPVCAVDGSPSRGEEARVGIS